ncbi:MAG: hypothetical protein IJT16_10645 [Lachnospiraceae bacterium]|nr:hypothetical protein [Lachnospiraceae bacterium]
MVTCSYNGYSKDAFYSDGFEYQTRVYVENPAAVTDSKLTSTQKTRTYNLTIKTGTAYVIQMKGMIQPAIWRSKNNNIAFVDENGIVYGRSSGKTSLQMKVNGITHTINVVVN